MIVLLHLLMIILFELITLCYTRAGTSVSASFFMFNIMKKSDLSRINS